MTVQIQKLQPEVALEFWPELEPYALAALEYDPYSSITVDELREQIQVGYALVLIAVRDEDLLSATITQLYQRKDGKQVLHVLATAGGDSRLWLPALIDKLKEIAAQEGAHSVTMAGRPGWAKKLSKFDWRVVSVDMEYVLDEHIEKPEPQPIPIEREQLPSAVSGTVPAEPAGASEPAGDAERSAGAAIRQ